MVALVTWRLGGGLGKYLPATLVPWYLSALMTLVNPMDHDEQSNMSEVSRSHTSISEVNIPLQIRMKSIDHILQELFMKSRDMLRVVF